MGASLYRHDATFRDWMNRLDQQARSIVGCSIVDVLYAQDRSKQDAFDALALTGPAIFMVEYALAQTLIAAGVTPDLTLGASMGCYAALALADVLEVPDVLQRLTTHAAAVRAHCEAGAMIAVLASPALFEEAFSRSEVDLAAVNFDSHFVLATRAVHAQAIEQTLSVRDAPFQRLPVSFAFHSRWIEPVAPQLRQASAVLAGRRLAMPLVCCAHQQALTELPPEYLWTVARRPVMFADTLLGLEAAGPHRYVDVGPAGTLANFAKYCLPRGTRSQVFSILTPFGRDQANLATAVAGLRGC
jgi:acyl transferase domain-containing protein